MNILKHLQRCYLQRDGDRGTFNPTPWATVGGKKQSFALLLKKFPEGSSLFYHQLATGSYHESDESI
jgi:hypothetical protein